MGSRVFRRDAHPLHAWARYLSMAVAGWLVLSAFAWRHDLAQQTDAWAVGSLAFFFSLAGLLSSSARWLNALLALWLFATTLFAPALSRATVLNDCIAAALLFALSLVPGESVRDRQPDRTARV